MITLRDNEYFHHGTKLDQSAVAVLRHLLGLFHNTSNVDLGTSCAHWQMELLQHSNGESRCVGIYESEGNDLARLLFDMAGAMRIGRSKDFLACIEIGRALETFGQIDWQSLEARQARIVASAAIQGEIRADLSGALLRAKSWLRPEGKN